MDLQAAQFYIPKPLYLKMKVLAKKEGKSLAAWGREVLEKEVEKASAETWNWDEVPIMPATGKKERTSEQVKEILYGRS